jgi:hypothetical protein
MSKADALRSGHEAWRAAGGERPAPCEPLERARRNPQSRALAIAAKCWDCMGGDADPGIRARIRQCPITRCPLHAFRPYQRSDSEAS